MPKGIFLLIHDEMRGPEIKCSYYTSPMILPQEFISKLYMSHAGFKSSSHLEIKLSRYRSISCFTGNLDRRTQKEGILGILFEENESYDNLDLFLQRSLYQAINKPNNQIMEEMFSIKLSNYLLLIDFLEKVEIEDIIDISIVTGGSTFVTSLIRIGERQESNSEKIDIYQKIMKKQQIPLHYYIKLDLEGRENTFLIIKVARLNSKMEIILKSLKPYLEKFFFYSLEILTLFLFPTLIRLEMSNSGINKESFDEKKSMLQNLKNSENYRKEFNNYISKLIKGSVYISPNL